MNPQNGYSIKIYIFILLKQNYSDKLGGKYHVRVIWRSQRQQNNQSLV